MGRSRREKMSINNISRSRMSKKPMQDQTPEWVININSCLEEGLDYDSGRWWTIYRVPRNMRLVHRNSFIPKIISIGPFHYGEPGLESMEEHKMRYLLRLLGGKSKENGVQAEGPVPQIHRNVQLEELERAMKALEGQARERYSESFDMDSDEFVQMMVLDGCFVIELLRLYTCEKEGKYVDDPIFTTRWMLRTLQRDLLMLENQLPFFVLEELYLLTRLAEEPSLQEITVTFFDPLLPRENRICKLDQEEEFDHMLDVFRSTFLSSVIDKTRTFERKQIRKNVSLSLVQERQLIHSVSELQEARVKLKNRTDCDLLDIKFKGRVLEIPTLYLDDNTVPLLLNCVAYEQSDQDARPLFTNYFMFFDSIINSYVDVEILHQNGIINHVLGSNEDVAHLFNKLGREIVYDLDDCYLSTQIKGINDHCKAYYANKWHIWWSNLINEYFNTPWSFLSLLAAIVLLLLTAGQTFYAIYAYYHPT
ncbi:Protein of unknown function DUF247, plant [Dillenia turbinata]|uniref:Uncharacterized protein n=1 Tax=Dillenia turbinata TaxID=194707 RepID=A0AAN8WJ74_9MAGN